MILLSTSILFLLSLVAAAPQVQLGDTTIIGRSIPLLQQAALEQDFFGGERPLLSQSHPLLISSRYSFC